MLEIRACSIHVDIRAFSSSGFFLYDARHATSKKPHRKCSLILNVENELMPSLLGEDSLNLNGNISRFRYFWSFLERKTIKYYLR